MSKLLCFQIRIIILPLLTYTAQAERNCVICDSLFQCQREVWHRRAALCPLLLCNRCAHSSMLPEGRKRECLCQKTSLSCGFMGSVMLMGLKMGLNNFSLNSKIFLKSKQWSTIQQFWPWFLAAPLTAVGEALWKPGWYRQGWPNQTSERAETR